MYRGSIRGPRRSILAPLRRTPGFIRSILPTGDSGWFERECRECKILPHLLSIGPESPNLTHHLWNLTGNLYALSSRAHPSQPPRHPIHLPKNHIDFPAHPPPLHQHPKHHLWRPPTRWKGRLGNLPALRAPRVDWPLSRHSPVLFAANVIGTLGNLAHYRSWAGGIDW